MNVLLTWFLVTALEHRAHAAVPRFSAPSSNISSAVAISATAERLLAASQSQALPAASRVAISRRDEDNAMDADNEDDAEEEEFDERGFMAVQRGSLRRPPPQPRSAAAAAAVPERRVVTVAESGTMHYWPALLSVFKL